MPYAFSHPELRQEVPRFNKSGHPDQDEGEANPRGFDLAIAEQTEQRVCHKNEPSDRGEQNQCEKVVRAAVSHEVEIKQRSGNQGGAYESTPESKTAEPSACALNLWSWVHAASPQKWGTSVKYLLSQSIFGAVRAACWPARVTFLFFCVSFWA